MPDRTDGDAEADAEIEAALARGRQARREATAETAPDLVRRALDMTIPPADAPRDERTRWLETLAVTSWSLPRRERELGSDHPLVAEWRRLHDEAVEWLYQDGVRRVLDRL